MVVPLSCCCYSICLSCTEFLDASATYITEAPFPRIWMQGSPSEPAIVAQTPVPAEHAAWFDASRFGGVVVVGGLC